MGLIVGFKSGPIDCTRKRSGYFIVSTCTSDDAPTSRAVLLERDVEVWSGPVRSGPRKRLEVLRDLEEKRGY